MRNKLAKNSIAVGLVTLIVTAGLSFSAQGAPDDVAQATSTASEGSGLFSAVDLQTGTCSANLPAGTAVGAPAATPTGDCGAEVDTAGVDVLDQSATASLTGADGISTATAQVAGVTLPDFEPLDLTNLITDLGESNTTTLVGTLVNGLSDGLLKTLALQLLAPLTTAIDDSLQTVLDGVETAVPFDIAIGAVSATCDANPTTATGNGNVSGIDLNINILGQDVVVPVSLGTAANSPVLVTAPQDLVDDVLQGLQDTFVLSLGGVLAPLAPLVAQLTSSIIDPLFDALEPTLLQGLSDLLEPVLSGTVNKQTPVSPAADAISVNAIELFVLGQANRLALGNVTCGPNATAAAADDDDAPADEDAPADDSPADVETDADNNDADAAADADNQADADVTTTLPATGSPNLLPFWMLGLGLLLFGATVLLNEKRRLQI